MLMFGFIVNPVGLVVGILLLLAFGKRRKTE
jgi:hypothetical protein